MRLKLSAIAVALAIGVLPIVPAEHVHETADEGGHHTVIAHRHSEPHGLIPPDDRDPTMHDKDPMLTLEPWFVVATRVTSPTPLIVLGAVVPHSTEAHRADIAELISQLIHGPPRALTSLRAPPPLLAL